MIIAIIRSILPLIWSMVMFLTAIYAFAVYLTQQQTFYLYDHGEDAVYRKELQELFGDVGRCAITLFMCVTGGINWGDAAKPLVAMSWSNQLLMVFYIFFILIAVMNVITGIFVEGAIASAVTDKEELIQDQLNRRDSELAQLRNIFAEGDVDGSGTISKDEFVQHCQSRRVRALLRAIGLDVDQACYFFKILDTHNSGELPIQELVVSCMRLKGSATAMDMAAMMRQTRHSFDLLKNMESVVRRLAKSQHSLAKTLTKSDPPLAPDPVGAHADSQRERGNIVD